MAQPLMPMATAVWLVDNTALSFTQIATFCEIHELEVQGIADGTVGMHMVGQDPIANGQLTQEEIDRCQADSSAQLQMVEGAEEIKARAKGPRYTPLSKRQDKPDAIAWLVRNHPELADAQISRLVGTTKPTIQAIRDKSHWNSANITAQDPVGLGLCKQVELDEAVQIAHARQQRANEKAAKEAGITVEELTGQAPADEAEASDAAPEFTAPAEAPAEAPVEAAPAAPADASEALSEAEALFGKSE